MAFSTPAPPPTIQSHSHSVNQNITSNGNPGVHSGESQSMTPSPSEPMCIKRGRGRPKGSGKKKETMSEAISPPRPNPAPPTSTTTPTASSMPQHAVFVSKEIKEMKEELVTGSGVASESPWMKRGRSANSTTKKLTKKQQQQLLQQQQQQQKQEEQQHDQPQQPQDGFQSPTKGQRKLPLPPMTTRSNSAHASFPQNPQSSNPPSPFSRRAALAAEGDGRLKEEHPRTTSTPRSKSTSSNSSHSTPIRTTQIPQPHLTWSAPPTRNERSYPATPMNIRPPIPLNRAATAPTMSSSPAKRTFSQTEPNFSHQQHQLQQQQHQHFSQLHQQTFFDFTANNQALLQHQQQQFAWQLDPASAVMMAVLGVDPVDGMDMDIAGDDNGTILEWKDVPVTDESFFEGFVAFFLGLLSVAAASPVQLERRALSGFSLCDANSVGILAISDLSYTPNPPQASTPLSITVSGVTSQNITSAQIKVQAKWIFGITVLDETIDLCTQQGVSCPIPAGQNSITFSVQIPSTKPSIKVDVTADVKTNEGSPIVCVRNKNFQL
ncbi:Phosphatidylglycerol/phosphatidylinositol transfer protein [Phlyctochytrium planicorne]|nr:Phosphatidylglycerol/phosphatidylinositol transfer protein [Phlyctochytrium planicorne]